MVFLPRLSLNCNSPEQLMPTISGGGTSNFNCTGVAGALVFAKNGAPGPILIQVNGGTINAYVVKFQTPSGATSNYYEVDCNFNTTGGVGVTNSVTNNANVHFNGGFFHTAVSSTLSVSPDDELGDIYHQFWRRIYCRNFNKCRRICRYICHYSYWE